MNEVKICQAKGNISFPREQIFIFIAMVEQYLIFLFFALISVCVAY